MMITDYMTLRAKITSLSLKTQGVIFLTQKVIRNRKTQST